LSSPQARVRAERALQNVQVPRGGDPVQLARGPFAALSHPGGEGASCRAIFGDSAVQRGDVSLPQGPVHALLGDEATLIPVAGQERLPREEPANRRVVGVLALEAPMGSMLGLPF